MMTANLLHGHNPCSCPTYSDNVRRLTFQIYGSKSNDKPISSQSIVSYRIVTRGFYSAHKSDVAGTSLFTGIYRK